MNFHSIHFQLLFYNQEKNKKKQNVPVYFNIRNLGATDDDRKNFSKILHSLRLWLASITITISHGEKILGIKAWSWDHLVMDSFLELVIHLNPSSLYSLLTTSLLKNKTTKMKSNYSCVTVQRQQLLAT